MTTGVSPWDVFDEESEMAYSEAPSTWNGNLFSGIGNDPVNLIDAFGLDCLPTGSDPFNAPQTLKLAKELAEEAGEIPSAAERTAAAAKKAKDIADAARLAKKIADEAKALQKIERQIRDAGLPTGGKTPFDPKLVKNARGDSIISKAKIDTGPKAGKAGYVDKSGRIWIKDKAHAGDPEHWDVQINGGQDYCRVGMDGNPL
jgi:hypothetical protein